MIHYVYETMFLPTGHYYIGVRSCKRSPWKDPYLGSGFIIRQNLRRFPASDFSKRVLRVFLTRRQASSCERRLVTTITLQDPFCWNLREGGDLKGTYGRIVAASTRVKIGDANRGKKHTQETKAKIAAAMRGRIRSPEHCRKLSEAQPRRPHTPENVEKNRATALRRWANPAWAAAMRRKIAESKPWEGRWGRVGS